MEAIKSKLYEAGIPNWAMDVIDGPNGKEVSVSYDILDEFADEAKIKAMKFEVTDKGLCFA